MAPGPEPARAAAAAAPAGGDPIRVEVIFVPTGGPPDRTELELARGSTLEQALCASGVLARHGLEPAHTPTGIWGRRTPGRTVLREGDRVEVYRPLLCDPKEARRLRHRGQGGSGSTGGGLGRGARRGAARR
ncbi:MAG: RnfH family protein [Rubrivivax sp.]